MTLVRRRRNPSSAGLGIGLGGAALGAALAYWLDPQSGARRRAQARQKAVHAKFEASDAARIVARDLAHRSSGLVARMRSRLSDVRSRKRGETEDDAVLEARVRAKLGRVCAHPSAIEVSCRDGTAELKGPILRSEADRVLRAVSRVRGVRAIDDDLEPHESAGNVPELQGGTGPRYERAEWLQEHWSPATRTLAGAAGIGLFAWGSTHPSVGRAAGALAGAGLLLRSVVNLPIKRLVGSAGRRAAALGVEVHGDASGRARTIAKDEPAGRGSAV